MKINISYLIILVVMKLPSSMAPKSDKYNIQNAIKFVDEADKKINKLCTNSSYVGWDLAVNMTKDNQKKKEKATEALEEYQTKVLKKALRFKWKKFKKENSTLHRWFQVVTNGKQSIEFSEKKKPSKDPYAKMVKIYSGVKVCPPNGTEGECLSDFSEIFARSRDPKVLKHYWLEIRRQTGEKFRDLFLKAVKQDNEDAIDVGFKNKAQLNIGVYEDKKFVKNLDKAMRKLQPFYKQIHAFVRKKLRKYYKEVNIQKNGPIPAHILGDQFAQSWNNIYEIVRPYPKYGESPNVTKTMLEKEMKEIDMFIMAEKFFTSIGFPKMTPRFWRFSLMEKPHDREVDCHASAHDFYGKEDYRIKMCTKVNFNDLEIVHHEMGHVEFFMLYSHLPYIFRDSANPGIHEAVGDTISMSVLTPEYLKKVGLLESEEKKENRKKDDVRYRSEKEKASKNNKKKKPNKNNEKTKPKKNNEKEKPSKNNEKEKPSKNNKKKKPKNKKATINFLMATALRFAVRIPYAYVIDHWRNNVYEGEIKEKELNKKYWEDRLKYQGVCPPSKRTEEHFDIGAKYHIAAGIEYNRYLVAHILQFQFHKILCKKAGHKGPLHECNIYESQEAGKAFKKFLSEGKSKNWKRLLREFSDGEYKNLDVSAVLEYYKPLIIYLKKRNKRQYIGWKSDDPMSCPGDESSTETTSSDQVFSKNTSKTKPPASLSTSSEKSTSST